MGSSPPSLAVPALCLALSACFVDSMGVVSTAEQTTDALTTSGDPATTDPATGDPECADFKATLLVEDATVVPPMTLETTKNEDTVAFSEVTGEGTVAFTFVAPCAGIYTVWGRVLDPKPGAGFAVDPDMFSARVDDGPEVTWHYGCTTTEDWSWQPVQALSDDEECEAAVPWRLELTAGEHAITLRNLEDGFLDEHAAVARLFVTNDPDDTPLAE